MPYAATFTAEALTRTDAHATCGPLVLEFGTNECSWCRAAQPYIRAAFEQVGAVAHVKIEDGPGRPLGRSFRVKLWPTLVFLRDGTEVVRLVRPQNTADIADALARIAAV